MEPLSYRHWICEGLQRSTSANRAALSACTLGTFSHTTCYPIGFASWTGQHTLKTIQKTQWNILGDDETSHALHSCLPCGSLQRSTSANHLRASRLVLGTFSHASPFANRLHPCGVCLLDGLCESSPRHISTGRLHALRRFHSPPINLIVFEAPYRITP